MSPPPGRRPGKGGGAAGRGRAAGNSGARRSGGQGRPDRRDGAPGAGRGRPGAETRGRPPADRGRQGLGGDQVEGRRAVRELLVAGRRPVHDVWMAEDLEPAPVLDEIERLAAKRHARLLIVPRRRLEAEARTDAPQGVLAHAGALVETDLDDLCQTQRGPAPFLVVFDGVTDPHNLGALLRSAECAGVTGVVVPRHRAVHVSPTVTKVAAGAVEHLPMAIVPGVPSALQQLTRAGVTTIGLDAEADVSLFALGTGRRGGAAIDAAGPLALVIGAEGKGLALLTRKRCDVLVSIPQHGTIESLNVAAAGAVAFFEVARARAEAAAHVQTQVDTPTPT